VLLLHVITDVIPNLPILLTLGMEVLHSSETLVLARFVRRSIQENTILHSHCSAKSQILQERNLFRLPTMSTRLLDRPAHRLVAILTEISPSLYGLIIYIFS
jgi:hypothetical protein